MQLTERIGDTSVRMPRVAIILGSLAHKRFAATFKGLRGRYEPMVVACKPATVTEKEMEMPVLTLPCLSSLLQRIPKIRNRVRWGPDQYLLGLDKVIANCDVVLSHSPLAMYSYQAAKSCKRHGKPLVLQEVANVPLRDLGNWNWRYRAASLEAADIVTAVTERARALLLTERVPADKIRLIPYGVDTSLFAPGKKDHVLRTQLGLADDDIVVLFAGRMDWNKGILDLVQALHLLNREDFLAKNRVKAIAAGHGPDSDTVGRQIHYLGLENYMRLISPVSYGDMPRLYHAADFFVAPSIADRFWREQWGLVISEAMSSGLPVVAGASGAIPEVVGDSGLLVQPADPLSLAAAMRRLIESQKLRHELGQQGRARMVELFDSSLVGVRYADMLDEALERNRMARVS